MVDRTRSTVFRITGLPADRLDDDLETNLRETLTENFTEAEKSEITADITILPDCDLNSQSKICLIHFNGKIPQFLSKLVRNPLANFQVMMGKVQINFDRHFLRFTQLYATPKGVPISADIIAITGLDGHAYGSWRGKGNFGNMWLRDFLSKDLPRCRTMIYGYNSKLSVNGLDTILDYGRVLMEEIKLIRSTKETSERPLIFIAHSFGGIIVAHCLVKAIQMMHHGPPEFASIYKATYGIIFFGTPHRGLAVDDIRQMLGNDEHPRQNLLRQISSTSDILMNQLGDFKDIIHDRKIVSFYENLQTRKPEFNNQDKRWRRTGEFVTAVSADSALLQLPAAMEDKISLDADHSSLCKFDQKNEKGYRMVLEKLRQYEIDAPNVVANRFLAQVDEKFELIETFMVVPPTLNDVSFSTVPFKRDSTFVGRQSTLDAIQDLNLRQMRHQHTRISLVGLAGVGKSGIATEYSYRIRENAPNTSIFWIHASDPARFKHGYERIASAVNIPIPTDQKTNICQLVFDWLQDHNNGNWLLIMDNADDESTFFNHDTYVGKPLVDFIPHALHGSILFTSRNKLSAHSLVGNDGNVIIVPPMNENESIELLESRTRTKLSTYDDKRSLVEALEYIPLSISQAGSYIAHRNRMTVARYLRLFRENEDNELKLLDDPDAKDLQRDPSITYSVVATWKISFEQIRYQNPSSADLLSLMSMFARQSIPEYLIKGDQRELEFEDNITPLIDFSLIREDLDKESFDMHRVVQLSVRKWLEVHRQLGKWRRKSREIFAKTLPEGNFEDWTISQELLPHSTEIIRYINSDDSDALDIAAINSRTGWYLYHRGAYEEAYHMCKMALTRLESSVGIENSETITTLNKIGKILIGLGNFTDAEKTYREALTRAQKPGTEAIIAGKKPSGIQSPEVYTSANDLGLVLERQGKYPGAEEWLQFALSGRRMILPKDHPLIYDSLDSLGHVQFRMANLKEAEPNLREALLRKESVLGKDHPDTIRNASHLALVLNERAKYKEAEDLHRRVYAARERNLGSDNPDTLLSLNDVGTSVFRQGKVSEAEEIHRAVLARREHVLGKNHPDTLTTATDLALVLLKERRFAESEILYRSTIEGRVQVLGDDHPETQICRNGLGKIFMAQEKYLEAAYIYKKAFDHQRRKLSDQHPATLASLDHLGSALQKLKDYGRAEALFKIVLEGQERALGASHPSTCHTRNKLRLLFEEIEATQPNGGAHALVCKT